MLKKWEVVVAASMYEIVPGILEKEWSEVEKKIALLTPFAKALHVDIIDNKFAPNLTILDPSPFAAYKDQFLLEVHLMVVEPINYLKPFAQAGFKRFLGHVEQMSDQEEFVAQGQILGEVGLALDGPTTIDAIKVPYADLDVVHFYISDRVGFAGPPMMPERLERIRELRQAQPSIPIEVDGGIKDHTIKAAKDAGATRFVATSFISQAQNPKAAYLSLLNAVSE